MRLAPIRNNIPKRTRQDVQMRGINLTDRYSDGEMESCKGISTDRYPYITTQEQPATVDIPVSAGYKPISMFAWEKLFVVTDEPSGDGFKCFYGGEYCGDAVNTQLPKQYAVVNNKLVMFPDKIYFNLYDETMSAHQLGTAARLMTVNSGTIVMRKAVSE